MSKLTGTLIGAAAGAVVFYTDRLAYKWTREECQGKLWEGSTVVRASPSPDAPIVRRETTESASKAYHDCVLAHPWAYRYEGADGGFGASVDLAARAVATVVVCSIVGFALSGDGSKALTENASSSGFEDDFDEAFEHLRRKVGRNLVPLVDMRDALGKYSRSQFDAGLKSLQKAWRYGLVPHEGRSGTLSAEAKAAGISQGERLMTFVRSKADD